MEFPILMKTPDIHVCNKDKVSKIFCLTSKILLLTSNAQFVEFSELLVVALSRHIVAQTNGT